jgi:putative hydrolase of the HAD superfamily
LNGQEATKPADRRIKAILFDFGGVLAEEGFRQGLMEIARSNGLDPVSFFELASAAAYNTGYALGKADEKIYWDTLREKAGIRGSDEELRREILSRFVIRPWMIDLVRSLRDGLKDVSILSDQTNWLDELEARYGFFQEFTRVFNSYHMGKGKKDPELFSDIARELGLQPSEILFIDDNEGHTAGARSRGLNTILYRDRESLFSELAQLGL